ncbi:segregation/condensation protein A [Streptococcus agalactiae]|uniref:segregation/condensation protein A n=1 Tax=Streptococcus agalactiae TaxID=1311 RepID=UPI0002F19962|nr:segregation/condensation protein A [Streptococcus agalactiae]EPW16142.1 segregation and condensation protein A [Streptococcus agalactiae CCUG 17336]HEO6518102.1 segregation/condensation protein A [Streptococcus agalactiae]HEO6989617.1 segregation/condensation protein A [Streptococcus agalactiae]
MDIKLKDFEGPLDLLLHLVSKYEVDIYDVPIVEVIEQYLAYIATLQAMRLEVAGEYMLMASQLMLIKSRNLLPKVVESNPIEDDPEMELLSQLEEYRRFKVLSEELANQHQERAKYFSKPKQEVIFEDAILLHDKSVMDLFLTFSQMMSQKQKELSNSQTVIEKEDYRIEDMMIVIERHFNLKKKMTLQEVFADCQTKSEMITLFLAMLELIKLHQITVEQDSNFSQVILRKEEK